MATLIITMNNGDIHEGAINDAQTTRIIQDMALKKLTDGFCNIDCLSDDGLMYINFANVSSVRLRK